MTTERSDRLGVLAAAAVVLGAVATASNPVFVRLTDVGLVASAFHRFFWAIPIFIVWSLIDRAGEDTAPQPSAFTRRNALLLMLCGSFFAGDLLALHTSISLTNAANAILFLNAQPIYVVVIGWLLFGTLVTRRYVVSALVAMVGAALLVGQSADFSDGHLIGDGLGMVAGLCYASYIITVSRLRNRLSSATINLWTCTIGATILLIVAVLIGETIVPQSGRDWALMIGLGVVSHAIGQGLIVWGLAYLPASFSAVALLVAPVAAATFAWMILDEALNVLQLIAIAIVLGGIYGAWRASLTVVNRAVRPN